MMSDCWIVFNSEPFKVLGYYQSRSDACLALSCFKKYENSVCIVHAGMLCRLFNESETEKNERPF